MYDIRTTTSGQKIAQEAVELLHLPAAAALARSLRCEILNESPIRLRFRALISARIRAPRLRR